MMESPVGSSRLEKGLRALAWVAVATTVAVLLGMGIFVVHPAQAGKENSALGAAGWQPTELEEVE